MAQAASGQQLRAYVEYLRELGVYDLYQRAEPQIRLSAEARTALLARAETLTRPRGTYDAAAAQTALPAAAQRTAARSPERPTPARPVTAVPRQLAPAPDVRQPPAVPAQPVAAAQPAPADTEAPNYFALEAPAPAPLPPGLAAPMPKPVALDTLVPLPSAPVPPAERPAALAAVRADIGDCTRCPLAYAGRHSIVFGEGDPQARLLFVGEGPGADEDVSGQPFVGKAGQLLNNMIGAMGLQRQQVYIANVVKCRPPQNRTPEFVEASTCSQFLVRQIDIVQPQVIVALGSTAATYLLGVKQSLASLRGRWHTSRGAKVVVTYHPAFLLRDPRQKGEAWKDLQMAMAELGLKVARQ